MRITVFLCFIGVLQVYALPSVGQGVALNLKMKNSTLKEVLREIEENSEYHFFYQSEDLSGKRVTDVDVTQKTVFEVLEDVLPPLELNYEVFDKYIAIKSNNGSPANDNLMQQKKTVSGRVTDISGGPLPGVTVVIKGTTNGTITDANGDYSIEVPDNVTIAFSFVGMQKIEVEVARQSSINVIMEENAISLDEVVAVGYGTVKKSDLTGAVMRIKAETFQNQSSTQIIDMLAGSVAGLNISQSNTTSGESSLEVRGPTSLTGGTNPLIVLDGSIYNGNLSDINPNDIESVDVLKDASSAAVYGAKAASGVVIITTMKGKTGKPRINFTTKVGMSNVTNDNFRPLNGKEYENFRRDYFRTVGVKDREDWYWNDPNDLPKDVSVEQWRNASSNPHPDNTLEYLNRLNFFPTEVEQYLQGNTIDWFDEVMQIGIKQDYDLSISGGAKNYNYYWSVGYVDDMGIVKGDEFSTVRSRLNADYKISEWLKVGINSQFSSKDQSSVPASIDFERVSPYSKLKNDDGYLNWYPHDYPIAPNPLLNNYYQQKENKTTSFFASLYTTISLPLGFQYKLSYQPRYIFNRNYNFWGG